MPSRRTPRCETQTKTSGAVAHRAYFQIPHTQNGIVEEWLSSHNLDFPHFHASFINYAIGVVQRNKRYDHPLMASSTDLEDKLVVLAALRKYPTMPELYIDALEVYRRRVEKNGVIKRFRKGRVARGFIKSDRGRCIRRQCDRDALRVPCHADLKLADTEHMRGQLELYRIVFSKDERARHKAEMAGRLKGMAQLAVEQLEEVEWGAAAKDLRDALEESEIGHGEGKMEGGREFTLAVRGPKEG